jgi:probable addiction module antidote protein
MMALETKPFDVAEVLTSDERIYAYLTEAFETNDAAFIASAIGDVVRSRNMTSMSKATGLSRETLYSALSVNGNPTLTTMISIMKALGLKLNVQAA